MNRAAIICVDDEAIILHSLGKQLKRSLGKVFDIELASSGTEALFICKELYDQGINVALVISDHLMPGMSGDEFLIKLHASYPRTVKILLTGQANANSVGNIVNQAALYRYIAKPWDETDLILTVKAALKSYGQEKKIVRQNKLLNQSNNLLKQTNEKLSKSLELLLATFESADDGILVLDNQGSVVIFNQQFSKLFQINPASIEQDGNHVLSLIIRRLAEPIACDLTSKQSEVNYQKYNLLKLNNGTFLKSYFQTQQFNGEVVGIVWGFRDVTEREREKKLAEHNAKHDTLTQLPKRSILTCQLSEAIIKAQQNSTMLAIMFLDLDRYKIVSDTFGHQVSDILLKNIVQRLKQCLQEDDLITRWGRDEFSILFPKINSQQDTDEIAQKILNAFKSPFHIGNKPIYVNIHIGIALYPQHGNNAENILKKADAALTQAQHLSLNNYQYYSSTLNSQTQQLFTIENQLYSALKNDEFVLYYQPTINLLTGKIAKMEALLRWKNPKLGLLSPCTFISLAEQNGLIIPIGQWVLKTACSQNKAWQNMGIAPIKMSVNLSVRQFHQQNLVSNIASILEQTKLSASYLELEITESITMQNTESTKVILNQLNEMGISLSIDDFGIGYSSLGYLKQFPFNTLKIDRSLIKDLCLNSGDKAIVNAIITLGQGLNLNIVAEGVETEELRDLLKNLGCEYIQGYLFSKPLSADKATELLKTHHFLDIL